MAAGVIYQTVTTTTGETVELAFYVDDTVTPTTWTPVSRIDSTQLSSLGQTTAAASVPTVLATDQSKIPVAGNVAHDADGTGSSPLLIGGYASAAAPTSVSADGDAVRNWLLRNGATAAVITAAGALIGGDAANGLDVDVTRASIAGDIAHDGVDSGNPLKIGMRALAHGTNPTAVAAADRTDWLANRAGIPWVIGGHPNIITRSHIIADGDGAQTDAALLTVGAGVKIVLTQISVKMDAANTTNVAVKIGFGTATIPAASLAGTAAIVLEGQFAASGGHQVGSGAGIIAIGADNEDLRITCGDPVSGNIRVTYSYYTIES